MVRYGIIGVGAMGREHAENLRNIPGAQVVAISDPNQSSIEQAKSLLGSDLKIFNNHHDLLALQDLDAVIIATPNFTHVDVLKDALETDLAVFIEKPLCTTIDDCLRVIEWAKIERAWFGWAWNIDICPQLLS